MWRGFSRRLLRLTLIEQPGSRTKIFPLSEPHRGQSTRGADSGLMLLSHFGFSCWNPLLEDDNVSESQAVLAPDSCISRDIEHDENVGEGWTEHNGAGSKGGKEWFASKSDSGSCA